MTEMMSYETMRREVKAKLDSKEWWTLVDADPVLPIIEGRYYMGEKNALFHLVIIPRPYFVIAFAHKSLMTPDQLYDCLIEAGAENLEEAGWGAKKGQDILFSPDPEVNFFFGNLVN